MRTKFKAVSRGNFVKIRSLSFSGCLNTSAVVVNSTNGEDEFNFSVQFTDVEFVKNGRKDLPVAGSGLRVSACSENHCPFVSVNISDSLFEGNRGDQGPAVFAEHTELYINRSEFRGNEASFSGGAIQIQGQRSKLEIDSSVFSNNTCAFNLSTTSGMDAITNASVRREGGAINAWDVISVLLRNSVFTNNIACYGGGAITFMSRDLNLGQSQSTSTFDMKNCSFVNNSAHCPETSVNGIQQLSASLEQSGGALSSYSEGTIPTHWSIRDSRFIGNQGDNGGALYIVSRSLLNHSIIGSEFINNVCDTSGGAILMVEGHLHIVGVTITNCRALYGGGIMLLRTSSMHARALTPLRPTVFESNEAFYGGGLLCSAQSTIELFEVEFRNNTAFHQGGAVRLDDSLLPIFVHGGTFENNRALLGGAMGISAAANITLTSFNGRRTIFKNNSALVGGGLDYSPGHFALLDMKFRHVSFLGNHAISIDEIRERVSSPRNRTSSEWDHIDEFNNRILSQIPIETLAEILSTRTHLPNGQGGGLSMTINNIYPLAIVECLYSDVEFKWNTGRVGGGLSLHVPKLSFNRAGDLRCFPAYLVIETCRMFIFHNVSITENQALYSGGLFLTSPSSILCTCNHDRLGFNSTIQELLVQQINPFVPSTFQAKDVCTWIEKNSILDNEDVEGADAGSPVASLHVVDWPGPLKQVASGDLLAIPCISHKNRSCSNTLQIMIKDTYNQTIMCGTNDAELQLTLKSDNIAGETSYSAQRGLAKINRTSVIGINVDTNLTIETMFDSEIKVVRSFTTRACEIGEYTQGDYCVQCPPDQYGFNASKQHCNSCISNAYCPGRAALVPVQGYWHSTPFAPRMHKCFVEAACTFPNRSQILIDYYESNSEEVERQWEALNNYLKTSLNRPDFPGYNQCASGYCGILCGSCEQNYGKSIRGTCTKCPDRHAIACLLSTILFLWVLLVIGLNSLITLASTTTRIDLFRIELQLQRLRTRRPPRLTRGAAINSESAERALARRSTVSGRMWEPGDLRAHWILTQHLMATVQLTETLKIMVNYLQVVSTALCLPINWSKSMHSLLNVQAALAGVASEPIDTPFECNFNNWDQVHPATLAICLSTTNDLAEKLKRRLGHASWVTCVIVVSIITVHFSFIGIVSDMLRAVNCSRVDEIPSSLQEKFAQYSSEPGYHVWVEDTSQKCFTGEHLATGIVGIIGLVFALLSVVFIIVWLPLNKKHTTEHQFIARYWFLYQAYRREWYTSSWEAVILIRKAMIAAVAVFSVHLGPNLQASLCVGILAFAYILQVVIQPFKVETEQTKIAEYFNPITRYLRVKSIITKFILLSDSISLNGLESASLVSAALCFYSGILVNDSYSSSGGRNTITAVTILVNLLFLFYVLFRLYSGIHTSLDLYIETMDPAFMISHNNGPGLFSLCRKIYKVITLHKQCSETVENNNAVGDSSGDNNLVMYSRDRPSSIDTDEITQCEV
eukprot:g2831.t1